MGGAGGRRRSLRAGLAAAIVVGGTAVSSCTPSGSTVFAGRLAYTVVQGGASVDGGGDATFAPNPPRLLPGMSFGASDYWMTPSSAFSGAPGVWAVNVDIGTGPFIGVAHVRGVHIVTADGTVVDTTGPVSSSLLSSCLGTAANGFSVSGTGTLAGDPTAVVSIDLTICDPAVYLGEGLP